MRLLHLSDFHCSAESFPLRLRQETGGQLEQPDGIIITGDMLPNFAIRNHPGEGEMQRREWSGMVDHLDELWPNVEILAVRGNHDFTDLGGVGAATFDEPEGSGAEWLGLRAWGFRGVPRLYGAWSDEYGERAFEALCERVPRDTQLLVTHAPPHGVLDDAHDSPYPAEGASVVQPRNIGSFEVRKLVGELPQLRLHAFGHCHEQGGLTRVVGGVVFSNAACTVNLVEL